MSVPLSGTTARETLIEGASNLMIELLVKSSFSAGGCLFLVTRTKSIDMLPNAARLD